MERFCKNVETINTSLEGSAWFAKEGENNAVIFSEQKITSGKFQFSAISFDDITEIIENFGPGVYMSRYQLKAESAWALYDSIKDLRKRLRLALTEPGTKQLWMRVGISWNLSLEEFAEIESESDKGKQILKEKFLKNLCYMDGESYSPETEEGDDSHWSHKEINFDF